MLDPLRGAALNGIGAGFIHRLAAGNIAGDFRIAHLCKSYAGNIRARELRSGGRTDRDPGADLMGAPAELPEHGAGIRLIGRLAEDFPLHGDQGIGRQNPAAGMRTAGGFGLAAAELGHRLRRGEGNAFIHIRGKDFKGDSGSPQQLPAAGGSGSQNQGFHGHAPPWVECNQNIISHLVKRVKPRFLTRHGKGNYNNIVFSREGEA